MTEELQRLNARLKQSLAAYDREFTGEDRKLNPAPHMFEITFMAAAGLLVNEYKKMNVTLKPLAR